jgi:hypothetical protein
VTADTRTTAVFITVPLALLAAFLLATIGRERLARLSAPVVTSLTAKHHGETRALKAGGAVAVGDTIDFQIEVADKAFVYVYSVQSQFAKLEWGPKDSDVPWEKGVYAPDWDEKKGGMAFERPGEASIVVLASPAPIKDPAEWPLAQLQEPWVKCPHCAVASADFRVIALLDPPPGRLPVERPKE